jgi:prolipoprotein diacylglyceryltransferase
VFSINLYGLLIFFGIIGALFFLKKKLLFFESEFYFLFISIYLYSFIFGKLFFFIIDYLFYLDNFSLVSWDLELLVSGFSVLGASFGGIIALLSFNKKKTIISGEKLALVPIATLLVHAFGRIGCTFAGCCGGKDVCFIPLQCIASLFYFFSFFIGTIIIEKINKNFHVVIIYYACIIFLERFLTDHLREDAVFINYYFTKYQLCAASYIGIVCLMIIFFSERNNYKRCD